MKHFAKILMLIVVVAVHFEGAAARTIEIKMSQCPKPLLENVRRIVATANADDKVILNFDKNGTYEFDGSIKIRCNTIIKGVNSKKTRVIVKEGVAGGKSKMQDDTFFAVHGTSTRKVKVEVRDIRFELASHKGTLWETAPKHIIKVCDGDGIMVDNATFWSTDAVITHVDLRECSNVLVENCTFENYNNCREGGCLWSRGEQRNLTVRNNVFWKYGNDEALGFWGGKNNRVVYMGDILVENNEFHYDNRTKFKSNIPIDVLIAFAHFETNSTKYDCIIDNIVFKNNSITMNAIANCCMKLTFDKLAKIKSIEMSDNTLVNTSRCSKSSYYHTDIEVSGDMSNVDGYPIKIKDNNITSECEVLCDGKNSGYTFMGIKGSKVLLKHNTITSRYGVALLWSHGRNIDVLLDNNTVSHMYKIAILNDNTLTGTARITATSNEFDGETGIYCKNVKNLILDFTSNVFNATDYHFFMVEGAGESNSLTFDNNVVNSIGGRGALYANYSGKNHPFDKVRITNNVFNGIKRDAVEQVIKKSNRITMSGNIYK